MRINSEGGWQFGVCRTTSGELISAKRISQFYTWRARWRQPVAATPQVFGGHIADIQYITQYFVVCAVNIPALHNTLQRIFNLTLVKNTVWF